MSRDDNIQDPLDVSLTDPELSAEVHLMTQLIIAANESEAPLGPEQIDRLLGIKPKQE